MRKLYIPIYIPWVLLALLLGACGFTSTGNIVRGTVAEYGAQAMDEGLVNAEFFVCQAASVGSVMRRYGVSKAKAEAWRTLCNRDPEAEIIEPAEPEPPT